MDFFKQIFQQPFTMSKHWLDQYGTENRYVKIIVAFVISLLLYILLKGTLSMVWVLFYMVVIYLFYMAATSPTR